MRRLLVTMVLFTTAAGVNTASVAFQQRTAYLTRRFGPYGWCIHLVTVISLWVCFLALLPGLGRRVRWPLPSLVRPWGVPLLVVAALGWLIAFLQLGGTRTGNGNFFGHGSTEPVCGGIFALLRNPMYDSYVLALVGAALHSGNAVYLLLAGQAAVLFHIEADIENRPFASHRRARSPAWRRMTTTW
ncbi:MAG: methyltransferase [Dehalococcoidia bacterium]